MLRNWFRHIVSTRPTSVSSRPLSLETLEDRVVPASLFVATTGDDGGSGTLDDPFQTLSRALDVADPGDDINLRQGTYAGGATVRDPNITIRSYADEWAVLNAPIDDPSVQYALRFHFTADGGVLENIELQGGYFYALKTESNWDWGVPDNERQGTSNLLIQDCKLHGSGRDVVKITPGGDDITIRRCEIYDSGLRNAGNAEGIDNVNGDGLIVQDSYIHDIATNGIYVKGGAADSVIERNRISNTGLGGVMIGFYTDVEWFDRTVNPELYENIDGVVRNNLITNTQGAGIGFYAAKGAQAYNNTLVQVAQTTQAGILFSQVEHYISSTEFTVQNNVDSYVANNIVVQSASSSRPMVELRHGSVSSGLSFTNNLYHDEDGVASFRDRLADPGASQLTFVQWQTQVGDPNSAVVDPLLDSQHHLQANSPAIDAGVSIAALQFDIEGNSRTGVPDIGADEHGAGPTDPPSDPPVGTFRFSALPTLREGESNAVFVIERTDTEAGTATVQFSTTDGSALADSDYLGTTLVLTFAAGESSKTVEVPLLNDSTIEPEENFGVSLTDRIGTVQQQEVIPFHDDDFAFVLLDANTTVNESDDSVSATIQRQGDTSVSAAVNYATQNGTALAGSDFANAVGTLTFAPGETSKTVSIAILDDTDPEGDEIFQVVLSSPTNGGTLGSPASATVTIEANDPIAQPGRFEFASSVYTVNEGADSLVITVRRADGSQGEATVRYVTRNGAPGFGWRNRARAGRDYQRTTGVLTFAPGETEKTIVIPIYEDSRIERDEVFRVMLRDANGAELGETSTTVVTIDDNDAAFRFQRRIVRIDEGVDMAIVTVLRIGDVTRSASVDFATRDGRAKTGTDYADSRGTLTFDAGETSKTIAIPIVQDTVGERREGFEVTLSNAVGATLRPWQAWMRIVIDDDDPWRRR